MKLELLRSGACPSCGAPIQFASNSAAAQVCKSCNFVVARTDRDFRAIGRVADLVPIASPLTTGSMGKLALGPNQARMFRVAGRMQYDRADAPGAPWQEFYLELDGGAAWSWLAHAQGNWYLMSLYEHPMHLPTYQQALPGVALTLSGGETFAITERSARRPISGDGELPFPFQPGVVEYYADMSGPNGAFGTIDFGTGQTPEPPQIYFGWQIDPRSISIDGAGPVGEGPKTDVAALKCPGCGGDLPLAEPDRSERVVCRYCGTQSDCNHGALTALKKVPIPPIEPAIELGATGTLRGQEVTVVGFMVRGTTVDDERFSWREYLLYVKGAGGFVFLLEEDGRWEHIVPIGLGDLGRPSGDVRQFQGQTYRHKQTVIADVEAVIGEFYWKVEIGETVEATEFEGPKRQKIGEENTGNEVSCSYSTPLPVPELRRAFGNHFQISKAAPGTPPNAGLKHHLFWVAMFALWMVVSVAACTKAANKQVYSADIAVKGAKSSIQQSISAALDQAKKNSRIQPDGSVKINDLTVGAITSTAVAPGLDVLANGLKPKVARCFPGEVNGSFKLVATVGASGLPKTVEIKDPVGVSASATQCARLTFVGTRFTSAPQGAVITIPFTFSPTASTSSSPTPGAPAEADTASFSDPFEVTSDGRNLKLTITAPNLQNNWMGADIALVHESSGTVWEDSVELEYYSGVEGGESWSEGSRDKSLWYSRVPAGKYVLRIEPALDPANPAIGPLRVKVVSDTTAVGYVVAALAILGALYLISTIILRARLAAAAAQPGIVPQLRTE